MSAVVEAAPSSNSGKLLDSFLGHAPLWYKHTILMFLVVNVGLFLAFGPLIASWALLAEFIFTLALALKCFPLQPGGLLALQAVLMGLTTTDAVYKEVEHGLPVLLLVIFMVAGVHFLRDLLFRLINHVLLGIKSRMMLNFATIAFVSVLSAFLDALTILAVLIAVAAGFYQVYHRVISRHGAQDDWDLEDGDVNPKFQQDLEQFRAMLRALLMHGAIGTAIGGVCTLIGEPENIVIGTVAGWSFAEFFMQVAPATMPTLAAGLLTCLLVERFKLFGYGVELPASVRAILEEEDRKARAQTTPREKLLLVAQGAIAILMVLALALHVAEIGLIGLAVIVLVSAIAGITEEHKLAEAFSPGLPFAALLLVFFVLVAMIETQHMFKPIIDWVLTLDGTSQIVMIFLTNGLLSAISDNVFVATIYMDQLIVPFEQGITSRELFNAQSVAVVMGTGIPSMSTPNGQAAFLLLLTSQIAPLIRLGYGRMVWMALPYFIITSIVAGISMLWIL